MGADVVDLSTGEILPRGARTDDEWESYIREASVENTIIVRGVRWAEFFESCRANHGKRGGSRFAEFAKRHFGMSQQTASAWASIGAASDELTCITRKFSPDWFAMVLYTRLSADQKQRLLQSNELISQKTIKRLLGLRGDGTSNDTAIIANVDQDVRIGDFREVLNDIEDGSVKLMLTDPPYPVEFLPLWSDLAQFAATKLADDGILVAYSGKYALPSVLNRLSEHLTYWWTGALFHEGSGHMTPLGHPVRKVISQWRPFLMFVRNGIDTVFRDVVPPGGKDKEGHNWGQAISESVWIIEQFTAPGDLVVDPMAGSGTVAKASRETGRRFVGAELNG